MAAPAEQDDDGPMAAINIVPFVDVVLVLLVIFMLTSAAIVKASLKVELPKAASGGSKVESTVNILLNKQGELLVNGEKVGSVMEAAVVVKRETTAPNTATQAVIAADQGVEYGKVVELIDMVKQNGITAFALDIERTAANLAAP